MQRIPLEAHHRRRSFLIPTYALVRQREHAATGGEDVPRSRLL